MRKKLKQLGVSMMALAILAGCGGGDAMTTPKAGDAPVAPFAMTTDPITLTLLDRLKYPDENMKKYILDPLAKKYPNVTIQVIKNVKGTTIEELIAAGTIPDLVFLSTPYVLDFNKLDVLEELTPWVKKYNMPLDKLNQEAVDAIKKYAAKDKTKLYAVPFSSNYAVTYYNKDIFDKFGVPYPKDGMTWTDYVDLARKLTRNVDGVQYSGVNPYALRSGAPMSLNLVNPDTKQPLATSEEMVKAFKLMYDFYSIPGNQHDPKYRDLFMKNQTMATYMTYDNTQLLEQVERDGVPINWDMATFPTQSNKPGVGHGIDSHNIAMTSTSKNKEVAFQLINYLTSKEVQMELSKNGKLPALQGPDLEKAFGQNVNILKGKNIAAVFKLKPAPMRTVTEYDNFVLKEVDTASDKMAAGDSDFNTLLRTANEAADKAIKAEMLK